MEGMIQHGGPDRPEYAIGNGCGVIVGLLLGMLACLLMGSCSPKQTVVSARSSADSAWLMRLSDRVVHDSTVYRERIEVVPRVISAGDTAFIRMDTNVYRLTERNVCNFYTVYADSGHARSDSARADIRSTAAAGATGGSGLWQGLSAGIVVGIVLCVLGCAGCRRVL